jgi:hypothetical protein
MPTLREAPLAVAGSIINVETTYDRDRKFTGLRCLVKTGDGFTQTRLNPERANEVKPAEGDSVVWLVRPGAMKGDDGSVIFFTAFEREATPDDIDRIVSASKVLAAV